MMNRQQFFLSAAVNDAVPTGILCDIIDFDMKSSEPQCNVNQAQDFGSILQSHKKAVVFAVPGAFTPTCSVSHLPGFIGTVDSFLNTTPLSTSS